MNGLFIYSDNSAFPSESFRSNNYWVDVVFEATLGTNEVPPTVTSVTPASGSGSVPVTTAPRVTFSEAMDAATITTGTVRLLDNGMAVSATVIYNAGTRTATITPSSPLANSSSYTISVLGGAGGVTDLAGNPLETTFTSTFTTAPVTVSTSSLWSNSTTPSVVNIGESDSLELGVRFSANADGLITGIRYYKSAGNTGTHTGKLWSSNGQLLASVTFTGESNSGWQEAQFSTPVAITAGQTYVASYFAPNGNFSVDRGYFEQSYNRGPLTVQNGGGVFRYGNNSAFPSQSHQNSNYWVDVLFTEQAVPDTTAPTVTSVTPTNGAGSVAITTAPRVIFSEAMDAATITTGTVRLLDNGMAVSATVIYNAGTRTATITPSSPLANSSSYTISVLGGAGGVTDLAGNPLETTFTSTFTTAPVTVSTSSLWSNSTTPSVVNIGESDSLELGVRFSANADGLITGIRYYKSAGNTGTHTGKLWSSNGQLLASVTFTGESNSGWQEAQFSTPVAITAGQTYVASYFAPNGNFSVDRGYFEQSYNRGPLTVQNGGGVFRYGNNSAFPSQSHQNSNYWVDVLFTEQAVPDTTAPTVTSVTPTNGAGSVAITTAPRVIFSEAMDAATITTGTVRLLDNGVAVSATVSYNAGTRTATITPSSPLANSRSYTISVLGGASGVKDVAGNPLSQIFSSTFTTTAAPPQDTTPPTVTSVTPASGSGSVPVTTAPRVTFSEAMDAATITTGTVRLLDNGMAVSATVIYNAGTRTATITPSSPLANSSSYTISVLGGAGGVTDLAGNPLETTFTSTFTTAPVTVSTSSLWSNSTTPSVVNIGESDSLELGVRFSANADGLITGIRYYKSAGNTGTHTGKLWSSNGQLLASVTFTGESNSGWQEAQFSTPVAITAGQTYVASYFAPNGNFSVDRGYFEQSYNRGPLTVQNGGGVFRYGNNSAFPSQSHQNSNYWVDVLFTEQAVPDTTAPTVTSVTPTNGAGSVAITTAPRVIFSEAMDAATITTGTVRLLDNGMAVSATVIYNAGTRTATITPSSPLANSSSYTISVLGGAGGVTDLAGNPLETTFTSTFTTAPVTVSTSSLWSNSTTPSVVNIGESDSLELGVRFSANADGLITGIRYYKSAGNTGTHTGKLWSSNGQLLASVTFTGESNSGWQEAQFSTPVAITAGQTYVASYFAPNGNFSVDRGYFEQSYNRGPLTVQNGGGVFRYGNNSAFPSQSHQNSNYWVDVLFAAS